MKQARSRLLSGALAAQLSCATAGQGLPVFLADNHAESFAWVTRTADLDGDYLLVLTDAHSDASAAERSEDIREQLRRVTSLDERAARVESWRREGRIQAYGWIEPLMPRPFSRVLWVAGPQLGRDQRLELLKQAGRQCDGRLEVEPRGAGEMAGRWRVSAHETMLDWKPGPQKVIWSLDLDFFAGLEPAEAAKIFQEMWTAAMDWPHLEGISIAVSRPWLTDDEEADRLVCLALESILRTRGARLEIDASLDDRPDTSLRRRQGKVPRWDFASSSRRAQALIATLGPRCTIHDRRRTHPRPIFPATIKVDGSVPGLDEAYRLQTGEIPILRLRGAGGTGRVRWWKLKAARPAYDLLPQTGLGKGFSESPGRWIHEKKQLLGITDDFALAGTRWQNHSGHLRVFAEYESDEGSWLPVEPVSLFFREGSGFRAALSECRGMPYVFGIGSVTERDLSGPETGWGSDCANLLVRAWRATGTPLGWGDPAALRAQLQAHQGPVSAAQIAEGVMIDFDRHVAALWQDNPPLGRVDEGDLVFHHLGGHPEITPLSVVLEGRPAFKLWTLPQARHVSVRIAGDLVLAGEPLWQADGLQRKSADLFLGNLECLPTTQPPSGTAKYDFRFPPDKLELLKERGFDAISLANNHAGDAGPGGLFDALKNLTQAGIGTFGAGRNADEACRPWVSRGVACFGVSLVPSLVAGDGPGVASLPRHASALARELRNARQRNETIVVLVHWGDEYQDEPNEEQRRWARWLVARGAALVAGAGPHVIQSEEHFGGATIHYSLGNGFYPNHLSGLANGLVRTFPVALPASR